MGLRSAVARKLDLLEQGLQELRVEFERFFNGGSKIPPEELRNRLQFELRGMHSVSLKTAIEQYRLAGLEARFNSYNELFNRRMRAYEEGHGAGVATPAPPRRAGVDTPMVLGEGPSREDVAALYSGLQGGGDRPKFDLDHFQTYVERQIASIRSKTGCREVQFRLSKEDGKIKLKARPVGVPERAVEKTAKKGD